MILYITLHVSLCVRLYVTINITQYVSIYILPYVTLSVCHEGMYGLSIRMDQTVFVSGWIRLSLCENETDCLCVKRGGVRGEPTVICQDGSECLCKMEHFNEHDLLNIYH